MPHYLLLLDLRNQRKSHKFEASRGCGAARMSPLDVVRPDVDRDLVAVAGESSAAKRSYDPNQLASRARSNSIFSRNEASEGAVICTVGAGIARKLPVT